MHAQHGHDHFGFRRMTRLEASPRFRLVCHRSRLDSSPNGTNKGSTIDPRSAGDEVLAAAILRPLLQTGRPHQMKTCSMGSAKNSCPITESSRVPTGASCRRAWPPHHVRAPQPVIRVIRQPGRSELRLAHRCSHRQARFVVSPGTQGARNERGLGSSLRRSQVQLNRGQHLAHTLSHGDPERDPRCPREARAAP
jgi:hypothetical protein